MNFGPQFALFPVLPFGVAIVNAAEMLRRRSHDRVRWALSGVFLIGGFGYLVQVSAVYRGIDQALGVPNLSYLLYGCSFVLIAMLAHVWISTWPGIVAPPTRCRPGRGPVSVRTLLAMGFGVIAVLVALFAVGTHPAEHPGDFAAAYVHDPATAGLVAVFLLQFGANWAWAALRVHRGLVAARAGENHWLVQGLALIKVSMCFAIGYAVVLAVVPLTALAGVGDYRWLGPVATGIDVWSATLACVGFTCRVWGPRLERVRQARTAAELARRQWRQLDPLYRMVVDEADQARCRSRAELRRDPAAALARRVALIAMADARLADYRDDRVAEVAAQWGDALAEVIVLTAAVHDRQAGMRIPVVEHAEPRLDMPAETERCARLAAVYAMLLAVQHAEVSTSLGPVSATAEWRVPAVAMAGPS